MPQSFTWILFHFNKVFYRFEFLRKKTYMYIYWGLSNKKKKLKKKKKKNFELESKKKIIIIIIIKLLQTGQ